MSQPPSAAELASTPVRHLLVDLDGTLLGNRALALSADFLRQSFPLFKQMGGGVREAARLLVSVQGEFRRPSPTVTNDLRALALFAKRLNLTVEEARAQIRAALFAVFPKLERHFYPIAGAREFLEWARGRYTLTLATNPVWPIEIVEMRVRWAGLDPAIFSRMTLAREMHACKPSLEYYREILERQSFQAGDCLLVGNETRMDLPAVRAGIRVFIVGAHKKLERLTYPGNRAPAWKGSYAHLRGLLESFR
ncbi:MAG: HAD family hydrolase [Oligoflexia bacterium]|nr:HAD family hydrolase [Oligoflexia bacterium]